MIKFSTLPSIVLNILITIILKPYLIILISGLPVSLVYLFIDSVSLHAWSFLTECQLLCIKNVHALDDVIFQRGFNLSFGKQETDGLNPIWDWNDLRLDCIIESLGLPLVGLHL